MTRLNNQNVKGLSTRWSWNQMIRLLSFLQTTKNKQNLQSYEDDALALTDPKVTFSQNNWPFINRESLVCLRRFQPSFWMFSFTERRHRWRIWYFSNKRTIWFNYRVSHRLVLNFDFNFGIFWLSHQKNLICNKNPNGLT